MVNYKELHTVVFATYCNNKSMMIVKQQVAPSQWAWLSHKLWRLDLKLGWKIDWWKDIRSGDLAKWNAMWFRGNREPPPSTDFHANIFPPLIEGVFLLFWGTFFCSIACTTQQIYQSFLQHFKDLEWLEWAGEGRGFYHCLKPSRAFL